jgi:hypothetical protein
MPIESVTGKEEGMKTSGVGVVAVAILLAVTGIGLGIAQAGGTHSEQPVLSFEDMEAVEQGGSSTTREVPQWANSPAGETQLSSAGQEFVPESNWSGNDWQTRGPVEAGAIPGTVFEESWMKEYGSD